MSRRQIQVFIREWIVRNRQKILEQLELQLNQRLKIEIQQPLENMSAQKSINSHARDAIQLVIETIKRDSASLAWNSQHVNNLNNSNTSNEENELFLYGKETISSTVPIVKPSKENKLKKGKPRNLLFTLFRDVGRGSGASDIKNEDWSIETISTLFQLFLDQNCVRKEIFLKWNVDGHFYNDVYYKETKGFAQLFIQRLITSN